MYSTIWRIFHPKNTKVRIIVLAKSCKLTCFLVAFELFTELFRNNYECITPGQANQLIQVTTEELSQNRLNFIGALCSKYQSEIVDHLLSSIGPHTLT